MLAKKGDHDKEMEIYYVSKIFLEYDKRYILIKNFCYVIVYDSEKIRN